MAWKLAVALTGRDRPLFLQIARAITDDVRRGRLRAGASLPGSRSLADSLGVHRNTVLAAYRELTAEGWITSAPARGTFVSLALPEVAAQRFAPEGEARAELSTRVGYALPPLVPADLPSPSPRGVLSLNGGIPDVRLVPVAALARAFRRALKANARPLLSYGDPKGCARLRVAIAEMVTATRGLTPSADAVLVTSGSQMAIDLVARTLVTPGDVVAVEALGYRPAWEALRAAGARLVPLPVDANGVRVDALAEMVARGPVRALYVTPHHQYPTTSVLSADRRLALLELARRARMAILEDDYDHEFHYDGRPILPLASADPAGVVVYIGTLSKVLAPGLRIGYIVAPLPLVERVAAKRAYLDRQGDHVVESAVGELLEDGEVQRHIGRVRRANRERRDALMSALAKTFGAAVSFRVPAGGTALWVRVAKEIDVTRWIANARDAGVTLQGGQQFAFDGRARPNLRLGFAQLTPPELKEAVRRMALAMPARSPATKDATR